MKRLLTICAVAALVILAAGTATAGEITAGDFPDRSKGLLTWMNVEGFEERVIGTQTLSGFDITIDGTYDGVPIVGGEHKSDMYHWAMGWMLGDWQPGFASDDTYTSTAPEDIPGENSLAYVFYVTQTHGEGDVYIIEVEIKFKNGIKMRHTSRVTLPGVASFGSADLMTTTDGLGDLEIRRHTMSSPDEHYCDYVLNFGAGDSHGYLSGDLTAYSNFVLVLPFESRFITDSQGFRIEALTIGAPPSEVWVDDDYYEGGENGGHTWGYDAFDNIQDGINAVAGSTVNVANGTYNATSSPFVRITKSLTLIGESRDGVVLDGTGTSTIAWAKGIHVTANNVTIKNLTVQNFGAVNYWGYGVLFRDYAHDEESEGYIYYTGCVAENIKSQDNCYPMYALVNRNLTVRNCLIQNNLGDGMFIARGCDDATIENNTLLNSGDHGIWVGKCWTSPTLPSNNVTITNNTVNGAREGGISFVNSNTATIAENTITNAAGEGWSKGALSLKDGPSNVEAYNNTIYNNDGSWGGYSGTGHGVGIDGTPSNINLHHNDIYDNAGYGCYNYSTVVVMAKNNWWGDVSGPKHTTEWFYIFLPITNPDGLGDEVNDYVLYLPWTGMGGFVTGGGTIWSEEDESAMFMEYAGEANFGFVSKYKKGANVPDGNTNFVFEAGDLHFHSSDYDWLVVAGNTAKFKGTGTIEGLGDGYKFMLWAGDNDPDVDTFRILIWEGTEEDPVDLMYDNGPNDPITGGSIIIHKEKVKK